MSRIPLLAVLLLASSLAACERDEATDPVLDRAMEATEPGAPTAPGAAPATDPSADSSGGTTPALPPPAAAGAGGGTGRLNALFRAAEGRSESGEATFEETDGAVRIVVSVRGAEPGPHGIHVHERGDCSAIGESSMGGHFAPDGHDHGLPGEPAPRHLGDLGNIDIGEDGSGRLEIEIEGANLREDDPHSFNGRALVLHAGRDRGAAHQPSGDSGDPVACAVIGAP